MTETSVNLQEFNVNNEDGGPVVEKPILRAARKGDAVELQKLLREKKEYARKQPHKKCVYPDDWKYHFQDLLEKDSEGRTALHLAANVGNHDMSYDCVTAILESIQLLKGDEEGTSFEKHRKLVNMKDKNKETALHVAIENKAPKVVAYLLENQANMLAKNRKGVEALRLIYETLPDAINEVYNESVQLSEDYKKLSINWGPVIGFRQKRKKSASSEEYKQVPGGEPSVYCESWWTESEYLKYILISDVWGAPILLHPLLRFYLELKWKKIHWFFWVPFVLEMLWLFLYAAAFMDLNLEMKANVTDRCEGIKDISSDCSKRFHLLWIAMVPLTIICFLKELYQFAVLRKAYWSFENLTQVTFILLFVLQFGLLLAGYLEIVASVSVIGIILSTVLMIFQLGKTPRFGCQVAALKKVIYSCAPHLPVFFVWFIGFGLIFWAIFYKAEESWLVGMVAIMAAMGTGELNAQDHLEPHADGKDANSFREVIRVLSLLFFVIIIVTLYFNLLIGYAVSDIQLLKTKAEALELSNKLNTIYTIESFLITKPGQAIVALKCKIQRLFGGTSTASGSCMETIYVLPPNEFQKLEGNQEFGFESIPPLLLIPLKDVAYTNIMKENEKVQRNRENVIELLEPDSDELKQIQSGIHV